MSVDELKTGFRALARRFYCPEFVDQRSRNFRNHLRQAARDRRSMRALK